MYLSQYQSIIIQFCVLFLIVLFSRMVVEMRLPEIKSVLALQTMMRVLGKKTPLDLKRKLEV